MRSTSEPDPNSMTTTPAVACGTKTTSRPSPSPATNFAQASVRSTRPRRCPVWIVSSVVFIASVSLASRPRPKQDRSLTEQFTKGSQLRLIVILVDQRPLALCHHEARGSARICLLYTSDAADDLLCV